MVAARFVSITFTMGLLLTAAHSVPVSASASPAASTRADKASVVVSKVTPINFSIADGSLMGEIEGSVTYKDAVNLFAYNSAGARMRLSSGRFTPGHFRVRSGVPLNDVIVGRSATFFVSPSENGTHLPSDSYRMVPDIVVPAPVITSAVGGRGNATIRGTALRGARMAVVVAGQRRNVVASGHSGDWTAAFTGVSEGRHAVTAKVYDARGVFPDSAAATATVESEGNITRPLQVLSPEPGRLIKRRIAVHGVGSPGRGDVQVSLGGGPVVRAPVHPERRDWSALGVESPAHGRVPLTVTLPGTGEQISYAVEVAYFGDPVVTRMQGWTPPGAFPTLKAEGTVRLQGPDTEVRYLTRDNQWKTLAHAQEDGRWSYDGNLPRDLLKSPSTVDGKRYDQTATLTVPSNGDHPNNGVVSPILYGPAELTSPLRVGSKTTLSGVDYGGSPFPVVVVLEDGRKISAPLRAGRTWQAEVDALPLGPQRIRLVKDAPAGSEQNFTEADYVLEVVDAP